MCVCVPGTGPADTSVLRMGLMGMSRSLLCVHMGAGDPAEGRLGCGDTSSPRGQARTCPRTRAPGLAASPTSRGCPPSWRQLEISGQQQDISQGL